MAGFVFCHLVNCVVDGVVAQLLSFCGYCKLALAGAGLSLSPFLEVGLGVPYDLSKEFGEFCCVLSLFECVALEGDGYSGVSLAVCLTGHCQVHSYFRALCVEIVMEGLHYLFIFYYTVLEVVLTGESDVLIFNFYEFFFLGAALGAELRSFLSLIYVTADQTSEFLFHNFGYFRVNNSVGSFTNIVYLYNMTRYFSVADHRFFIQGEATLPVWDFIENYLPFEVSAGECLFGVEVLTGTPDFAKEKVYVQGGREQEQRLELYSVPEGWLLEMAPRGDMEICARMLFRADYSRAKVFLQGDAATQRFGLDNSLMVLFAFATAPLGTLEMHASVVSNGGKAYLFLGKSGTGKSTHSRLWLQNVPGTELVNDDNPVMRVRQDGSVSVYGSPWSGKTPCYRNVCFPVGAIVRIRQAKENRIARLPLVQAYASLASSCSGFRAEKSIADSLHATISAIVPAVPCFVLDCLPDAQAAIICSDNVRIQ